MTRATDFICFGIVFGVTVAMACMFGPRTLWEYATQSEWYRRGFFWLYEAWGVFCLLKGLDIL